MFEEAQTNLKDIPHTFEFRIVDAQQIPYGDSSFDYGIANNMLYHIPNLSLALSEIRRVLKTGGQCFATTIGQNVVDMFARLMQAAQSEQSEPQDDGFKFTLTSGASLQANYFPQVTLERLDRQVNIPDAGLLSAMLSSFTHMDAPSEHDDDAGSQKPLSFTFEYGLFIATSQANTNQ
ncbi:hypothetical protein KDH_01060 [Dictyobacter sp. S3.2.2.5]|uniref:Methyltransferase type 11 domain-containing protein n=2 Tax=Dictyobacter halimunensis TaxID=3026934 RepID=A0ABQ6FI58_9CHLR|nr:hypothetical protein KDH_01060 [Dictyobacter sp. S3.2.2.5]